MNLRRTLSTTAVVTAAIMLSAGIQVLAYTAPTQAPPGGDASAPLNTSSATQVKDGSLRINGKISFKGSPDVLPSTTDLRLVNQIEIQGGVPGLGKVLTSDAAGLATWQFQDRMHTGVRRANDPGDETSVGTVRTIALPESYSNTNYAVSVNLYAPTDSLYLDTCMPAVNVKSISSFQIITKTRCNGEQFIWMTVGR